MVQGRRKIAARIKERRKAAGLTQGDLAKRLGYQSYVAIARYEALRGDPRNWRDPDADTLQRLAEELNTTVAYLVCETDDPEQEDAPTGESARPLSVEAMLLRIDRKLDLLIQRAAGEPPLSTRTTSGALAEAQADVDKRRKSRSQDAEEPAV